MTDGFVVRMYKKYEELIKYGIFGVLTTIVSWGTYAIFVKLGIEINCSNILSWVCGVTFAFITNKWFVFKSKTFDKKILFKEITTFLSSRIGTGIIAIVLFPILYNMGMNGEFLGTDGFLAKITTSVIEIILNWVLSKYLVFNKKLMQPDNK